MQINENFNALVFTIQNESRSIAMQSLDFLTLHYALVLNTTILTVIWLGIALAYRDFVAARYWMAGSFMTAIGAAVLSFSFMRNIPVFTITGNFQIILGFGFFYVGLQEFYKREIRTVFVTLAILVGFSLAVTLVEYDNWLWRAAIYNLTYLVALINMLIFVVWRREKTPGIYVCIVALIIGALCQIYNLSLIFRYTKQIIDMSELLTLYSYNFLLMQFSGGTLTFGFFILTIDALRKDVEYLANRDELTGLPNRNQFNSALHNAEQQYLTDSTSYAILIIDIDNFKGFNDQYGHRLGDDILQHFSKIMTDLLQSGSSMSRHGGDEFCILMTNSLHQEAQSFAQCIKEKLAASPFILNGKSLSITVSTGIVVRNDITDNSIDTLLIEADKALYRVKRSGRNGYELYQPALETQLAANI